jgi:diaminohydroxyphosphoribosylaminopyrimidine deaminase/5-amino-6-(5-phosphoribosylamino)uracil reductase
VIVGIEEDACRRLNEGFVSRIVRGRPFTTLKLASTLDGRIATRTGDSRWITGEIARARVHALRRGCDAIAVGSGTAVADDPELTARRGDRVVHRPLPVVVDSRLCLSPTARLLAPHPGARPCILTVAGADAERRAHLEGAGAHVIEIPSRDGRVDLAEAWRRLGALGLNDLLVEGGGGLAAALLRAGLVDRFHLFLAPALIGGDGRPVLGSLGVDRLTDALRPRSVDVRRAGPDLHLTLEW